MTTVNPSKHKCCALCNRWGGNAGLTNQGAGRGHVRFNTAARGNCNLQRKPRRPTKEQAAKTFLLALKPIVTVLNRKPISM